jgi:multicomponent K+:H+ antiporter subunit D
VIQIGMPHLIAAPIVLPLFGAALLLLLGDRRRRAKGLASCASSLVAFAIACSLALWVHENGTPGAVGIYLPSNWSVPFGIVLAVDRLSALMLVLTAAIHLAAALYSLGRWDRAGVHFHPLFQLQLVGLNGAFLTADLFNLFVFFEVMLAASYGLLLHGSGKARVKAGLHYIAFNLVTSSLFLIGVAVLYGVTGTLNMADMAEKLPLVPQADRGLLHAGAAILAVAFLAKAAMWPLNFWLAPAYAAASAPAAAVFAIMTKVGIYAVLRLWTLFFPAEPNALAPFGTGVLVWGGLATLAFGAIGVMAAQRPARLAGYSIIVSSGTLLAAIGFGHATVTGGALFYLFSSTLSVSALFLLAELIERSRQADYQAPLRDDGGQLPYFSDPVSLRDTNLDDEEAALIGEAIPAAMAFLGLCFIACALLIAGLPPLSGFLAKFTMLSALLNPVGLGNANDAPVPTAGWILLTLLIGSGLLSMIAFSRAGIRFFWAPQDRVAPKLRIIECIPIVALLAACGLLTVGAGSALGYAQAAAAALHQPSGYIEAVMAARPVPNPPRVQAATEDAEP